MNGEDGVKTFVDVEGLKELAVGDNPCGEAECPLKGCKPDGRVVVLYGGVLGRR